MELIVLIGFVAIAFFVYSAKNKSSSSSKNAFSGKGVSAPSGESFLDPIPKGHQIFSRCEVSGTSFRKNDAVQFAKGSNQELELEREPTNPHDKNAIKVIGKSSGKKYHIGYVPKEVSEQIAVTGIFESIKPRLDRIYQGIDGYLEIKFQIIGPKENKKQFDSFFTSQPANSTQKEYYKFFGGLTVGDADQAIKEHRKSLETEHPSKLNEYDAYHEILEYFDDRDFREENDLYKVSRTILNEAINQLLQEGKTYASLASTIEKVVDRVLKLNPELEKGLR